MSVTAAEVEKFTIQKLSRDLRAAASTLGLREARYFVNAYYALQDYRIATSNQQGKLLEGKEPSEFMTWLNGNLEVLERQIANVLDRWSAAQPMGEWARQTCGIGPVIAAGLIAHIDIEKAPTVGHIWSYAGLNPNVKWEKGKKRPWNASLKRLSWIISGCFEKVSSNDKDVYGKLYLQRKAYEHANNNMGNLAHVAAERIAEAKRRKQQIDPGLLAVFESGKLPDQALRMRARRWTVKLFLAHWHGEAYRQRYGTEPPLPYAIAHLGHVHMINPQSSKQQEIDALSKQLAENYEKLQALQGAKP